MSGPASTDRATGRANGAERPILQAETLSKSFKVRSDTRFGRRQDVTVLDDISIEVQRGECFGLVGESGCGKSTLARCLLRLLEPSAGRTLFDGVDLSALDRDELRAIRRRMQFVFQDPYASLDPRMSAGAIVEEPLLVHGIGDREERRRTTLEMLADVGLTEEQAGRRPHAFSGGQRQRIGIARAFVLRPDVVILDEPISALDVSVQAQVLNMMRDLQKELGLTYMFISHDLSVVRYLSNHIGVMYLGKLVEIGPADEVYLRPAHPYTKGLIESAPTADPETERSKVHEGIVGELPSAMHPPTGCRFRTRCPIAQEICATKEPELKPYGIGTRMAACHFALQPPVEVAEAQVASGQVP